MCFVSMAADATPFISNRESIAITVLVEPSALVLRHQGHRFKQKPTSRLVRVQIPYKNNGFVSRKTCHEKPHPTLHRFFFFS